MAAPLTTDDARGSLNAHVAARGLELHAKYGPRIGWSELTQVLADRAFVRYPCELVFDATPLLPGEFAYPAPKGLRPEDGFAIHVHPRFANEPDRVPWLVLYQVVVVNYGEFASAADAETFGAAALGLTQDAYYAELCRIAETLDSPEIA